MKLTRIRLSQFRQFAAGLDISGIQPGMNVFHGPNESGKSTVVQAIRAAFFERHSTGTLGNLLPWGDSAAAPEVELDFEFSGRRYHLAKRFMRQARCDLRVDDQRLDGQEAEQHLAEFLGYSQPSRGVSRPAHWGVPGLLWLEQGAVQAIEEPLGHAQEHLQGILNKAMGYVASSDGDKVLQAVEERLYRLVTRATQAPTQDYRKALDQLKELETRQHELDQTIGDYRLQVDRLAQLQEEHARELKERPWESWRAQQEEARRSLEGVKELRAELQHQRAALDGAQKTLALLERQRADLHEQQTVVQRCRTDAEDWQRRFDALTAGSNQVRAALDEARRAHDEARRRRQAVRRAWDVRQLSAGLESARTESARLEQQLTQARALAQEVEQLQVQAAADVIDSALFRELGQLHERRQQLQIRRQSVATALQFELAAGSVVRLNDQPVRGHERHDLLDEATLHIPDVGQVRIVPGGGDIADVKREIDRLEDDWSRLLERMGVQSWDAARSRHDRFQDLQAQLRQQTLLLTAQAPDGVSALEAAHRRQQGLVAELESRIAAYGAQDDGAAVTAASSADKDVEQAEEREHEAGVRLRHCEEGVQKHDLELAGAQARLQSAHEDYARARTRAEQAFERARDQGLETQHEQAVTAVQRLQTRVAELEANLSAARPDILEQDIERLGRSADQLHAAHLQREQTMHELNGRLQALGAQGLEERRDAVQAERIMVARRVEEFARNAAALTTLRDLLQQQRQELARRLHAPLRDRLLHYLRLLFAATNSELDIRVSAELAPARLVRDHEHADVDELSFGAREQLGLISRLAYADLLRAAGRPVLIILDDVLVHSDAGRLARMKQVLYDAAQRHQILLFTCQPEKWQDMGVMPRAMADLRSLDSLPAG